MPHIHVRSAISLILGYVLGRQSSQWSEPVTGFDLRLLTEELTNTRVALQSTNGCEEDLRAEIRHSSVLSVVFRGLLAVECLLLASYWLIGCLHSRRIVPRAAIQEAAGDSEIDTPSSSRTDTPSASSPTRRSGPVRPSDLRRHGRSRDDIGHPGKTGDS